MEEVSVYKLEWPLTKLDGTKLNLSVSVISETKQKRYTISGYINGEQSVENHSETVYYDQLLINPRLVVSIVEDMVIKVNRYAVNEWTDKDTNPHNTIEYDLKGMGFKKLDLTKLTEDLKDKKQPFH